MYSSSTTTYKNAWVVQDLQLSTSHVTASSAKRKYSHLSETPFDSLKDKKIEILIGADHPNLHLYAEIKTGNNNEPIALHTTLGWIFLEETKVHLLVQKPIS